MTKTPYCKIMRIFLVAIAISWPCIDAAYTHDIEPWHENGEHQNHPIKTTGQIKIENGQRMLPSQAAFAKAIYSLPHATNRFRALIDRADYSAPRMPAILRI